MKNPNLAPDAVLIACPKCQAWPMAVNIVKPSWASRPTMQFTCAKCHFTSDQKSGLRLSVRRPFLISIAAELATARHRSIQHPR
jgi:hypothetical protein